MCPHVLGHVLGRAWSEAYWRLAGPAAAQLPPERLQGWRVEELMHWLRQPRRCLPEPLPDLQPGGSSTESGFSIVLLACWGCWPAWFAERRVASSGCREHCTGRVNRAGKARYVPAVVTQG